MVGLLSVAEQAQTPSSIAAAISSAISFTNTFLFIISLLPVSSLVESKLQYILIAIQVFVNSG